MSTPVVTTLDFGGSRRIQNLPAATAAGQPVIWEQLNAAIENLAWKDNARVATVGNINLSAPGASIDGIAMVLNDRFLARAQTAGAENGVYLWNGNATPATRAPDANSWEELKNAVVSIDEGTSTNASFRQAVATGTLNSTAMVWASFIPAAPAASETTAGVAEMATQAETDAGTDDVRFVTPLKLANWAGRFRKVGALIGDGTATQFTVTHSYSTRNVQVQVFENSGNYRQCLVEIRLISTNAIDIVFDAAPAANSYNVVIEA